MKKKISLQWQLTLLTALLVTAACLVLSYVISTSAIVYMDEIGDSLVTVIPKEAVAQGGTQDSNLYLEITGSLSGQVQSSQSKFWLKSLFVTLLITLLSSSLTYLIVGYALRPLQQLGEQVEEIQSRNMQYPVCVKTGTSEIIRLIEAFNGMLRRLSDALFAQRQFSANAAHELRTPLAVMQTKLEVLQKQTLPSQEDYAEAMSMMQGQMDRLSHVIDVLLQMTELQSAKLDDSISLAELVEEVLCDLEPLGEEKRVSLRQAPGDAQIRGSDTLMYRAIYNLVENAIKYNRPGGEVLVEIQQSAGFAQVYVTDSGCGVENADYERIFEPFFRVNKSRSRAMGGAGLGLALVKQIAQQHRGNVRVIHSSPEGTRIELSLYRS